MCGLESGDPAVLEEQEVSGEGGRRAREVTVMDVCLLWA